MRRTVKLPVPLALLGLVLVASPTPAQDMGTEEQRENGKQLYDKHCAQCHGANGDGVGHATYRLKPQPRDFTAGKYKFRTTPSGTLPTDADIHRVIKEGLAYTSMPAWPIFNDSQIRDVTYYLKTFSEDFKNPDKAGQPINIPNPPPMTEESVERGRAVYEAQGCSACHGNLGRGDGLSGPTLKDDWGNHIRAADMTMRWTFRGGATRQDIYQTFSTGVNGTPMPSYYDSVAESDRWDLVDYVYSLGQSDTPDYDNLLLVSYVEDELDPANAETLFEQAPEAHFPLVGQIVEPGRNFYPSATSIRVQAVYNRQEVLFRLRWNDMRAETAGTNGPVLIVPAWDEDNPIPDAPAGGQDDGADIWGDDAAGEEDIWGDDAAGEEDVWGDDAASEDDFWGEEEGAAAAVGGEFSDAVALQLPAQLPSGIAKPYFILGDVEKPVDLWFVDLARGTLVQQYAGRGSASVTPGEIDDFEVSSSFDQGQWTVLVKRSLRSTSNVTFQSDQYVPVAFSVWDGFNRERGNKRALSAWMYLYLEPSEQVSAVGPMVRAALITLVVEILIILLLRRRFGRRPEPAPATGRAVAQRG